MGHYHENFVAVASASWECCGYRFSNAASMQNDSSRDLPSTRLRLQLHELKLLGIICHFLSDHALFTSKTFEFDSFRTFGSQTFLFIPWIFFWTFNVGLEHILGVCLVLVSLQNFAGRCILDGLLVWNAWWPPHIIAAYGQAFVYSRGWFSLQTLGFGRGFGFLSFGDAGRMPEGKYLQARDYAGCVWARLRFAVFHDRAVVSMICKHNITIHRKLNFLTAHHVRTPIKTGWRQEAESSWNGMDWMVDLALDMFLNF